MALITRDEIFTRKGRGLGYYNPTRHTTGGSATAGNSTSGFFTVKVVFNDIGTTLPSTRVGIQIPSGLSSSLFLNTSMLNISSNTSNGAWLIYLYQIGTVNLATTGDVFTHNSATFPVLRTQFGATNQPVTLLPLLYITDATDTTAPALLLKNAAGTSGYIDQDGNTVIGTKTFTLPSATTAVDSGYILRLEDEDSGVRDINAINIPTSASGGTSTAVVFGMELLSPLPMYTGTLPTINDSLFGGLSLMDLNPAVATSGTATALLCFATFNQTGNFTATGFITGHYNV